MEEKHFTALAGVLEDVLLPISCLAEILDTEDLDLTVPRSPLVVLLQKMHIEAVSTLCRIVEQIQSKLGTIEVSPNVMGDIEDARLVAKEV